MVDRALILVGWLLALLPILFLLWAAADRRIFTSRSGSEPEVELRRLAANPPAPVSACLFTVVIAVWLIDHNVISGILGSWSPRTWVAIAVAAAAGAVAFLQSYEARTYPFRAATVVRLVEPALKHRADLVALVAQVEANLTAAGHYGKAEQVAKVLSAAAGGDVGLVTGNTGRAARSRRF